MPISQTKRKLSNIKNSKKLNNKTKKNYHSVKKFEQEITIKFFEMLLMIKLFHWKTHSYATHKATDELYKQLNDQMDQFIEILLGKHKNRIDLNHTKTIRLYHFYNVDSFVKKIDEFKTYLVHLSDNPGMKSMMNYDLLTIRDEILGNLNQFLYLLTFK
jgi:hypothetical protein